MYYVLVFGAVGIRRNRFNQNSFVLLESKLAVNGNVLCDRTQVFDAVLAIHCYPFVVLPPAARILSLTPVWRKGRWAFSSLRLHLIQTGEEVLRCRLEYRGFRVTRC